MRFRILAATLAAILSSGVAAAADAEGNYFIVGDFAATTCADLNAKLNDSAAATEIGEKIGLWAGGYLSALNRLTPNTYNVAPDMAAFFTRLLDTCKAMPELHLEPALWDVAKALYPARIQAKP